MALALLFFAYAIPLCWVYGRLTLRACAALPGLAETKQPSFSLTAILGLTSLAMLANLLSIFVPLGRGAKLFLLSGGIAYGWTDRASLVLAFRLHVENLRRAGWVLVLLVLLGTVICLGASVSPAAHYDTGLYYAQAIRWLEEYGVVPGLGNLHSRFAFNATWFGVEALFGLPAPPRHVLNSVLFFLFSLFCLTALPNWRDGHRHPSTAIQIALLPIAAYLFASWISSPTPDVPAALFAWTASVLFLEEVQDGTLDRPGTGQAVLVLLCAFAASVKMAVLPLVMLPLYIIGRHAASGNPKAAITLTGAFAFSWVPLIVQTTITSGYLVFPLSSVDLLDVDWKMPARHVDNVARLIISWARVAGVDPDDGLAMPLAAWGPDWYGGLPWLAKASLWVSGLLTVIELVVWASRRSKRRSHAELTLLLTAYAGVAYWLATAPAIRFGWPFLVLLPLVLATKLAEPLLPHVPAGLWTALLIVFLATAAVPLSEIAMAPWHHLVYPAAYPVPEVKQVRFGNFACAVPTHGDQCWYDPFPCTVHPSARIHWRGTTIHLRGTTWGQGFRQKVR